MSVSLHDLISMYQEIGRSFGFQSDSDFLDAWKSDPEKWSTMFNLRMNLIQRLQTL